MVRERGGTPFRQIFWSRNGAPANIVGHSWNSNTEAFRQITSYSLGWPSISLFSGPNCPQTLDLASKISKKFSGVTSPDPLSGRGQPPPAPTPSTATRHARGRKLPRCWDLGLGNRSPKSKFTTAPLVATYQHQGCQLEFLYNRYWRSLIPPCCLVRARQQWGFYRRTIQYTRACDLSGISAELNQSSRVTSITKTDSFQASCERRI